MYECMFDCSTAWSRHTVQHLNHVSSPFNWQLGVDPADINQPGNQEIKWSSISQPWCRPWCRSPDTSHDRPLTGTGGGGVGGWGGWRECWLEDDLVQIKGKLFKAAALYRTVSRVRVLGPCAPHESKEWKRWGGGGVGWGGGEGSFRAL